MKAEQDSFVSNQSQRSAGSTFSAPEGEQVPSEHYYYNSANSAHSFEIPK